MLRKTYLLTLALLLLLCLSSVTPAQQELRHVSGVVVDSGDGSPLPGVTVIAQNIGGTVQTNATGRFSLNVPAGNQTLLSFSKNGYRSIKKAIDSATSAVIVSMKRKN